MFRRPILPKMYKIAKPKTYTDSNDLNGAMCNAFNKIKVRFSYIPTSETDY